MGLNTISYGSGTPLVFFHGWGFDHSIWCTSASRLREDYAIHLLDLPGFGTSSRMSWIDFKQALLPRLPEKFVLVGWSMGGLFATRLALEAPEKIVHLVNVCSSPRFIKDDKWPGVSKVKFEKFLQTMLNKPQTVLQQFVDFQLQNTAYRYCIQSPPSFKSLKKGLQVLGDWDLRKPLQNFTRPTSYLFGKLDAIVDPKTLTVMQEHYPQFNYYQFETAAHIPFLSHPDEFISRLQFLMEQ